MKTYFQNVGYFDYFVNINPELAIDCLEAITNNNIILVTNNLNNLIITDQNNQQQYQAALDSLNALRDLYNHPNPQRTL